MEQILSDAIPCIVMQFPRRSEVELRVKCVSAPQGAFGADWAETGDSSEHFGGKSALYGTGAGCDGTGGTEGARCDGAGA